MESRNKLMGHPIHPMLVVFPLGLFTTAVAFDLLYLWYENPTFGTVSFWNIAAGIIGGLAAAVFGAFDWLAIPFGTRASRLGLVHGVGNLIVVVLFALSLWIRWPSPGYVPTGGAIATGLLAVALATVTGWLGGELVNRLGVGIDDGAHLNAPSSLTNAHVPPGEKRAA